MAIVQKKKDDKNLTFAKRTILRRQKLQKQLSSENTYSKSQIRKQVKKLDKEEKSAFYHLDKECGKYYQLIIANARKNKEILPEIISEAIEYLFYKEKLIVDALKTLKTSNLDANYLSAIYRPIVSRLLQVSLKFGSEEIKEKIYTLLIPVFIKLAVSPFCYRLCNKLLECYKNTEKFTEMVSMLKSNPAAYMTKIRFISI